MPKTNIRERAANKLQLMEIICTKIIKGGAISPKVAEQALKDIREIMEWLDKRKYST